MCDLGLSQGSVSAQNRGTGRSLQIVHNALMEGQTGDMDEAGGNAMPRGARLDAPGTLHHVMVRGIERKRIVSDDKDRKNLMDRMGDLARVRFVLCEKLVDELSLSLQGSDAFLLYDASPEGKVEEGACYRGKVTEYMHHRIEP